MPKNAPQTICAKPISGFALVIALTLMAFVLLLIISMSLLVQVETSVIQTGKAQLQARESARLALMIAIGELQKHAGPDQRVTARAEILGDNNFDPAAKFWTGVWDTTDTTAEPKWLVSGEIASAASPAVETVTLQAAYDANGDGLYDMKDEYPAVEVELIDGGANSVEIAWWISDEGVKAPLSIITGIEDELDALAVNTLYLGYNGESNHIIPATHDPAFDFKELIDASVAPDETLTKFSKIQEPGDVDIFTQRLSASEQNAILAELGHSTTTQNGFVLSNPTEGGLKKDLSYLKVLDTTTAQAELNALYGDNDNLLNPAAIQLAKFRGNPTAFPVDEILGMQLDQATVTTTEDLNSHFSLAPVITEFQFSAGVAADSEGANLDTTTDTEVYLVYKLYLEIWNPYTIPFRVGDSSMADALGYSDLSIEVSNLPSFTVSNDDQPANSITGTLDDISIKWSDSPAAKTLRPGMVYLQTLPTDSFNNGKGAIVIPLTTTPDTISGTRRESYTGSFSFSDPLKITIYGINSSAIEKEIFTAEITYSDFEIAYDGDSSATRFKRNLSIQGGRTGITGASLEQPGYAFAFRFKMLDEQEHPGPFTDISDWLSKYDIRNRSIKVDLATWDINDAWSTSPPIPYDFDASAIGYDPSVFDPSESFSEYDFFYYNTSTDDGRQDRIARFIDLPTSELIDVGIFRSLKYRDYNANSMGSSWGTILNRFYDRYFFSTLPDPAVATWDGSQPLANSRLQVFEQTPSLANQPTADSFILSNGFNLNSTSQLAWEKALSGKSYSSDSLELKHEQNASDYFLEPTWSDWAGSLQNALINHPQTSIYNLVERESDPRYSLITKENASNYIDAFSIGTADWIDERQYPAFWQPIRELSATNISDLAEAIVEQTKRFYAANNRPLYSIEELLTNGLLDESINSVPEINNRTGVTDLIPPLAPAHISQTTIMNALGPMAFVRSDTFRIKAYARTKDPITGKPLAEALCEATVQRTPSPHSITNFGREFRIVNIRWLDPNS
ncbi:MAG: hypothetical protein ACSHX8_06500 [Opitutaceae bacterium]